MLLKLDRDIIKDFYEIADSIFLALDETGTILYLNEKGHNLLGYTFPELEGENWFNKCVPGEEYNISFFIFKALLSGKEKTFQSMETSVITKAGRKKLIAWNAKVVHEANGKPRGILLAGNDVTNHRELIDALLKNELRLKKLIESITDYRFIADVNIKSHAVNYHSHSPGCFNVTGYSEYEFNQDQQLWEKIIFPEDKHLINNQLEQMFKGKMPAPIEHRIIHKNGKICWVSNITNLYHRISGGYSYDILISDISERKKIETDLRKSEAKLQIFTEATFEAIFLLENEIVTDVNEQALIMFRAERERLIGRSIGDFFVENNGKLLSYNTFDTIELTAVRQDDTPFPAEVRMRLLESSGKSIRIFVIRDITEKKEAEKKILNTIVEVEEREKRKFSRELHDGLGPILSSVKLYLDLLSETTKEDKRSSILSKTNECLNEAIRSLKEISGNLSPNVLNVHGIPHALNNFMSHFSGNNKLQFQFRHNLEERFDKNIEISLYRIVTELINNTVKHADASIVSVEIMHNKKTRKLRLSYSDNGKGINLDDELKQPSGMGFTNICQRVNFLRGSISFDSSPGNGFRVEIIIPVN